MGTEYGTITRNDFRYSDIPIHAGTIASEDIGIVANYRQQEDQRKRMALQAEEQMKIQTKAMQLEFDKNKAAADSSGKIAAQFLEAWGSSLTTVAGMYGDASNVIKGLMNPEGGGGMTPQIQGLKELSSLMKQEYDTYKADYGGMEKEFMTQAQQLSSGKTNILKELAKGGGTWVDEEGAAARAKADAGIQGELQNQAEARKLMAMGIDPSSGRFGALTRKSAVDMAGQTVKAMNLARQTEKTQGTARGLAIAGAINPNEPANIGLEIGKGGREILGQAGQLEQAGANVQSQYINSMGQLGSSLATMASGVSRDITSPLAEMAGYYSGLSGGAISPTTKLPTAASVSTPATNTLTSGAINNSGTGSMASYKADLAKLYEPLKATGYY
jgi:hypothetical protein